MALPVSTLALTFAEAARPEFLANPILGLADSLALVVGALGIGVILWGTYGTAVRLIGSQVASTRGPDAKAGQEAVRSQFAASLLLGLEFLIGAGLIRALVAPDWQNVAVLGGIVLIRTVTSFSHNWEAARSTPVRDREAVTAPPLPAQETRNGWALPEAAEEAPVHAGR
jgi:uncharacterized membrane protein